MDKVKIVQIGSGKVAKIRRQNYPQNTKVVALVVRNIPKYQELAKSDKTLAKDILITSNLEQVFKKFSNNLIWDIVADDKVHFDYTQKILACDSEARIILGKIPYRKNLIDKFANLIKNYSACKISITENYAVSQVTVKVCELMTKYNFNPKRIILEFTKNRTKDIQEDRFIHYDIGVLGYEGAHMITILANLGKTFTQIKEAKFEDLILSSEKILKNQGSVKILGKAGNSEILFYTSMNGKILNKLAELGITSDIPTGDETRFRVLILENGEKKIIGQYDPVPGLKLRPYGGVLVKIGDKTVEKIDKIYDNTMRAILEQQICYLIDTCANPMSLETAKNFVILEEVYQKFKN